MKHVVAAMLVVGLAAGGVRAQPWAINRIADTTTVSPGGAVFGRNGAGTFYQACLSSDGNVAFSGITQSVGLGAYRTQSGGLIRIADQTTPVPGVAGATFDNDITSLTFDGGPVTFVGLSNTASGSGIFSGSGGPLQTIANQNTPIPGGTGNFSGASSPYRSGGAVAFAGFTSGIVRGFYRWTSSGVNTIVDINTAIPNGSGNFTNWGGIALTGDRFAFSGRNASRSGLYSRDASGAGALSVIADTSTPIPGGSGNFTSFGFQVAAQGPSTAFVAGTSQTTSGVFAQIDNQLLRIADTTTPGPSGELFVNFQAVAVSGNNVAFVALANNFKIELVVWRNGVMSTVASTGDFINGIRLEQIQMTSQALRGDTVAFSSYRFIGTPQLPDYGGVYTATYVPAPGTALILGLMMVRRRRR